MIKINLLPEDRIKKKGTPKPLLAILVVGIALIAGEAAAGVYLWMQRSTLIGRKQDLEEQKEELAQYVEQYQKLQSEITRLTKRKKVLEQIQPNSLKERYRWSFSVDKLFSVVNNSPGVWLTSLEGTTDIDRGGRRRRPSQAAGKITHQLEFVARSAGELKGLTKFEERIKRRMIEDELVYSGLNRNWRPFSKGTERGDEFVENIYWTTKFTLLNRKMPGQKGPGGPGQQQNVQR